MNRIFKHHSALITHHSSLVGGFTLNEVMMTVIIVGILAAIAIPSYRKTIERGYWRTAQDLLMAIYNGERAYYYTNNNTYHASIAENAVMSVWREIYVDNPNLESIPVKFRVESNGASFTAIARRTSGPCPGSALSITQERVFTPDPTTTSCWCNQC